MHNSKHHYKASTIAADENPLLQCHERNLIKLNMSKLKTVLNRQLLILMGQRCSNPRIPFRGSGSGTHKTRFHNTHNYQETCYSQRGKGQTGKQEFRQKEFASISTYPYLASEGQQPFQDRRQHGHGEDRNSYPCNCSTTKTTANRATRASAP